MITDDFQRPDESPLGGDWTSGPDSWAAQDLVSGTVRKATNLDAISIYTGSSWDDDQSSEFEVVGVTSHPWVGAAVNGENSGDYRAYVWTCAEASSPNDDEFDVYRVTGSGSTWTSIGASSIRWDLSPVNPLIGLTRSGNTLTGHRTNELGTLTFDVDDTTWMGGFPGIAGFGDVGEEYQIDNWEGTGEVSPVTSTAQRLSAEQIFGLCYDSDMNALRVYDTGLSDSGATRRLDATQILQTCFDPDRNAIRILRNGAGGTPGNSLDWTLALQDAFDPTNSALRVVDAGASATVGNSRLNRVNVLQDVLEPGTGTGIHVSLDP